MISLKHLLLLMGSVSLLMTIAVVVVKVNHPGHISLAEVRAIDRLCHRFADDMLEEIYLRDDQGARRNQEAPAKSRVQVSPQTQADSSQTDSSQADSPQAESQARVSSKMQAERLEELHTCMMTCREYLITSRSKVLSEAERDQLDIPACFGSKLTQLVKDARSTKPQQAPSSSQSD